MGMAVILLNGAELFKQYPFDRRPYVNYVKSSPKILTVAKQFY